MAIAFDSITTNDNSDQTVTISHTAAADADFLIYFGPYDESAGGGDILDVTWNGSSLTKIIDDANAGDSTRIQDVWYIAPADTGTHDLVVSRETAASVAGHNIRTYSGVDTTASPTTASNDNGGSTAATSETTIASAAGHLVVDGITVINSTSLTVDSSQTERSNFTIFTNEPVGSSDKIGTSVTTMTWTHQNSRFVHSLVDLTNEAAAPAATTRIPLQALLGAGR